MFATQDLQVRYGAVEALSPTTIHVMEGEFVAVVGINGAGKSSLMTAIAGLTKTAGGQVVFQGHDLTRLRPYQRVGRGLVLVPERRHLFPRLTIEETLRVACRRRSDLNEIFARTFEIFPALARRRRTAAGLLSGGEQQMLALARGIAVEPRILLVDEPLLGLSAKASDEVYNVFERLRERGVSLLVSEENAHRLMHTADRTYVLSEGRVLAEGVGSELLARSSIEYALLGENSSDREALS
jgi:branched-chain amino acid transport system ATP-binding protein